MPSWTRLERPRDFKESDLQWMFQNWSARDDQGINFAVAGAPTWLLTLHGVRSLQLRAYNGVTFAPDVEWQTENEHYVVELKCARKGEPLALAQVLYYSDLIAQEHPGMTVVPGVVSQYSLYLRRALRQLRSGGYDVLQYLEHDVLGLPNGKRWFLWFNDPFAALKSGTTEGAIFEEIGSGTPGLHWYSLSSTGTWLAVEKRRPAGENVLSLVGLECRHLSLAKVQPAKVEAKPEEDQEWLVWYGETAEQPGRTRWVRNEYFLWAANRGAEHLPCFFT